MGGGVAVVCGAMYLGAHALTAPTHLTRDLLRLSPALCLFLIGLKSLEIGLVQRDADGREIEARGHGFLLAASWLTAFAAFVYFGVVAQR
jgi:hypothetical protein